MKRREFLRAAPVALAGAVVAGLVQADPPQTEVAIDNARPGGDRSAVSWQSGELTKVMTFDEPIVAMTNFAGGVAIATGHEVYYLKELP